MAFSSSRTFYALFVVVAVALHLPSSEGQDDVVWGSWSKCTKTCGKGEQSRIGYVNGSLAFVQTASCSVMPCQGPYEGRVWTDCSETCDTGERSRSNIYDNETQAIRCNTHSCDEYNGDCRGDIVIILDSSGSIVERNWYIEKQFAIDVIKGLKVSLNETHVGVISYSTTVETILDLGESYDVDDIEATIWDAPHKGGLTSLTAALSAMRTMFNESGREGVKHIAVFVSDAVPNVDFDQTIPEANVAKAEGVAIFFVGSGRIDYDMMVELASSPADVFVMNVTGVTAMQNLTQYIDNETCRASSEFLDNVVTTPAQPQEVCDVVCGNFGPCSESCGADGIMQGNKECWLVTGDPSVELPGSRYTVDCEAPCFIPCPTGAPDCSRCDYTKGQIWLEDRYNCHMYFICEPLGNEDYRIHHVTCGELFWNQAYHTCVPVMQADANCDSGPIVPYAQPSTTGAPCPYEPYPGVPSKFWVNGDPLTISNCLEGMEFVNMGDICDCLPTGLLIPQCEDDLLLYFPYEDHFNDVTCHQAIATQYGDGVSLQYDAERNGSVACFTGETHFEVAYLRTWFANNKVDKFTVSVRFKRKVEQTSPVGIVNNGDCIDTAGFLIGHADGTVMANITTEEARAAFPVAETSADDSWYHVVWVYDGQNVMVYLDGVLKEMIQISGYLENNDVPMYIANCCGENFFIGCLDELRVYNRVLSQGEIQDLP